MTTKEDNVKPTRFSEALPTTSNIEEVVSPGKSTLTQDSIILSYHAEEGSSLTADLSPIDDVLLCPTSKAPAWVSEWKALLGASDEVFDDDDDDAADADAASSTSSIPTLSPPCSPPPLSLSTYPQLITDILTTDDIEPDDFDKILTDLETSTSATTNSPLKQWLQAAIANTRQRFNDPSKHSSKVGAAIYLRTIHDLLNWPPAPPSTQPPAIDEPTPASIRSAAHALWQSPSPTHLSQRQELKRQERIARRLGHDNVLTALATDKRALNLARLHSCQQHLLAREATNLPPSIPRLKDELNNLYTLHTSHLTHPLSQLTPAQTTLLTLHPHLQLFHRATSELPLLHSQACAISSLLTHTLLHTARKHATYASRLNARDVLDPDERQRVRRRRRESSWAWVYLAAAHADLGVLAECARVVGGMFEVLERELDVLRGMAAGVVVGLGAVVEAL